MSRKARHERIERIECHTDDSKVKNAKIIRTEKNLIPQLYEVTKSNFVKLRKINAKD